MWQIPVALLVIVIFLLAYLDVRKPKNFPPGPRWFPIIGCAWQIRRQSQKDGFLPKAIHKLASEYGPLVGTRIGCDRIVFVHGSKATEELTTREEFNYRPDGIFYTMRTRGKRRGIAFTDSQFWQEQRLFVLRQLKHFGLGKQKMVDIIEREVGVIIDNIKRQIGKSGEGCAIRMDNLFDIQVLNTLWYLMTGDTGANEANDVLKLHGLITDLFQKVFMVGTLFSHFPFLRFVCPDRCGYTQYVDVYEKIYSFLEKGIHNLKETCDYNHPRGLIDAYLKKIDSTEKQDNFSEDQLLAICLDLFLAGLETTSRVLNFLFLHLLLNPNVQKKAQEEIDRVVGKDNLPTLKDKPRLKYVECVIFESLRMFVGRGFLAPRRAIRDTHFNGYFIPKDTVLVGNSRGTLMDENSGWPNPEAFDPERFMENGNVRIPDNFMPFGIGKRRCLGEILARADVFLIVVRLLQTFHFEASPDDPPILEFVDGFAPNIKPFKALISLR